MSIEFAMESAAETSSAETPEPEHVMLEAFRRRNAYWTTDLTLLTGLRSTSDTYWALERLEERKLVERVVRFDPVSWRLTELGASLAATATVREDDPAQDEAA